MNHHITFCAVYRNEANRMRYGLSLAKQLFNSIVVAVQDSSDATLAIAKEYADKVIERPEESPEESRDLVMEQVVTPWTFWLDGDEIPSLHLIHFLEMADPTLLAPYDGISFIRHNYIEGVEIDGNQGTDRQFKLLKQSIRWNPQGQGRRIHIHPQVKHPHESSYELYHIRTLGKVRTMTYRWNELDSATEMECNKYVKDVETELWQKTQQ